MYNPYNRYTEQSVMTMTSGEMLVKLYEETAKQLKTGVAAIDKNDVIGANAALKKSQTILKYLTVTLDRRYPIANNLYSLYDFFSVQISEGNARMNSKLILDIIPMLDELQETFAEGERMLRRQQQSVTMSPTNKSPSLAMNG